MSLKKQPNGKYLLTVYLKSGGRMRLVAYSDRRASLRLEENIKVLDACIMSGERPDRELSLWLDGLPERFKQKLVKYNLVSKCQLEKNKSLEKHLDDFIAFLMQQESKGALQTKRIKLIKARLTRLFKECDFVSLVNITVVAVDNWISIKYKNGELSAKTLNHYLQNLKQFCKWLFDHNRLHDNLVSVLRPIRLNSANTQQRRALSENEISRLMQSTVESEEIYSGLNGIERSMVYQLALTTGLRHNEIRTLNRDDFDLDAGIVIVRDVNAKNDRTDILPLQRSLQDRLYKYFIDFPALPKAKAFAGMGTKGFAMLKKDLIVAGIAYENEYGKADFHALRHTFCSMLAKSGVLPQIAQRLMRHSDINLTMKAYTHILIEDKKEAIAVLPEINVFSDTYDSTATVGEELILNGVACRGGEKLANSADLNNISTGLYGQDVSEITKCVNHLDVYKPSVSHINSSVSDNGNICSNIDTNGGGGGNRTRVLQYHPKELLRV